MLTKNPIRLTENKEISVKVTSSNGEDFFTNIKLEYGSTPKVHLTLDENEKEITVTPISQSHRNNYFLSDFYEQDFFNTSLFRYLYTGKANKDNLKKVHFIVPELASYFDRELDYTLDGEVNISGRLKIESLGAKIDHLGLTIEIHQGYVLKSNEFHDGFSFKNYIYFSYESDTTLNFSDIEKLMYKTIGLLTWLTGYPISIDSIEVSDGEEQGYLYVPIVKKIKNYDLNGHKSLIQPYFLRESFQNICNNYFSKNEVFEDIWSRTLPLFSFQGVLEYEVMLFASVLDKYFSYHIKNLPSEKIENYDSYIEKIGVFLKENAELKEILKTTNLLEKIKLTELTKVFPENTYQSFLNKQKQYFKMIDSKDIKIFLDKGEFYKIISIRDNAAHGSKEKLSPEEVLKYSWKVKLLSIYLIYMDLGISNDDFFKFISISFHPIVLNCEINRDLLEIKTGKLINIKLNKTESEKLKSIGTKIKVFRKINDTYFYNEELSIKADDYFSDDIILRIEEGKFYSYEKYLQYVLDHENTGLKAKYYPRVYLEEKNSKQLANDVIIVS